MLALNKSRGRPDSDIDTADALQRGIDQLLHPIIPHDSATQTKSVVSGQRGLHHTILHTKAIHQLILSIISRVIDRA